MKKIKEILENYKDYETFLDDRFGRRFIDFLSIEEMESIGFELKEKYKKDWKPKEWNEENIIQQLKQDIEFGIEKALDEKGIYNYNSYDGWRINIASCNEEIKSIVTKEAFEQMGYRIGE